VLPDDWTRVGGSNKDWEVIADDTQVLAQDGSQSSTFRVAYASGAARLWSGATTISARVRTILPGTSGAATALLCLRYAAASSAAYCLALIPNLGAQIQQRSGSAVDSSSDLFTVPISSAIWYRARLSIDAAGGLTASLDGVLLGTYTPRTRLSSGYAAVATQSAEAAFDDIVVSLP